MRKNGQTSRHTDREFEKMISTETPLSLISIHFRGGNYAVVRLGHSVPFMVEVKERVKLHVYSYSGQL